jgi:hypothetical protein
MASGRGLPHTGLPSESHKENALRPPVGRIGAQGSAHLVAGDDSQVGAALLCLQDCGLPFAGEIVEAVGVE